MLSAENFTSSTAPDARHPGHIVPLATPICLSYHYPTGCFSSRDIGIRLIHTLLILVHLNPLNIPYILALIIAYRRVSCRTGLHGVSQSGL